MSFDQYLDDSLGLETVVMNCNKLAMDSLNTDQYDTAVRLLHKANFDLQQNSHPDALIKLKAMTLNNLGCLYKRMKQYGKALTFLTEALSYQRQLVNDFMSMSGTHLNICAIRSNMGEHEKALGHALRAIELLRSQEMNSYIAASLVIAYNNTGVEYESLGEEQEASRVYYEGWEVAVEWLGRNHPLASEMLQACQDVAKKGEKPNLKNIVDSSRTYLSPSLPNIAEIRIKRRPKEIIDKRNSVPYRLPQPVKNKQPVFSDLYTFYNSPNKPKRGRRKREENEKLPPPAPWKSKIVSNSPSHLTETTRTNTIKSLNYFKPQLTENSSEATNRRSSQNYIPPVKKNEKKLPTKTEPNPYQFDNRIHFIGDEIVSLQKRMSNFEDNYLPFGLERISDSRENIAFFSRRNEEYAIMIQKHFRGYQARNFFRDFKKSAYIITRTVKEFLKSRRSPLFLSNSLLVAWDRGSICKPNTKQKRACIVIERGLRGLFVREWFNEHISSMKIQKLFKQKVSEEDIQNAIGKVIKLQQGARRLLSKKTIEEKKEKEKEKIAFQKFSKSAENRKLIEEITNQPFSEKIWLKIHEKVSLIQSVFKKFLSNQAFKTWNFQRVSAAIDIQRNLRGYVPRFQYKSIRKAAIEIQRMYKGYKARAEFIEQKQFIEDLQIFSNIIPEASHESSSQNSLEKEIRSIGGSSAIYIEEFSSPEENWAYEPSPLEFDEVSHELSNAEPVESNKFSLYWKIVVSQALIRGFLERKRTEKLRKALVIERNVRKYLFMKMIKKRLKDKAVRIERIFRGYTIRKAPDRKTYVKKIQAVFRTFKALCWYRREKSSLIVQEIYRAFKVRLFVRFLKSSVSIESKFRGFLVRKKYKNVLPVVWVQKAFRIFLAKIDYIREMKAVYDMQKAFRTFLAKEFVEPIQTRAKVEAGIRVLEYKISKVLKPKLKFSLEKDKTLGSKLASFCLAKKIQIECREKLINNNRLKTGSRIKTFLAQKEIRSRLGISRILRAFRGFLCRFEISQTLEKNRREKFTAIIRNFLAFQYVSSLKTVSLIQRSLATFILVKKIKMKKQINKINTWWRMILDKKKYIQIFHTLKIQSVFRAFLTTKTIEILKKEAEKRNILMVAKIYKSFLAKVQLKEAKFLWQEYRGNLAIALMIKAIIPKEKVRFRRSIRTVCYSIKTFVLKKEIRKEVSLVRFQAMIKGVTVRLAIGYYLSARKIQAHVRGFIAKQEYIRQQAAAVMIGKHVRGWQVRGIYLDIRSAVVFIQTFYRMEKLKKRLKYRAFKQGRSVYYSNRKWH